MAGYQIPEIYDLNIKQLDETLWKCVGENKPKLVRFLYKKLMEAKDNAANAAKMATGANRANKKLIAAG